MKLLSLIGEQPIPNLLVHRALKPEEHILACTETTERVAANLAKLLDNTKIITVSPYDFQETYKALSRISGPETIINLTAGTKLMAFAAYETAQTHHADFVYLRSQGRKSILYSYDCTGKIPVLKKEESLNALIDIDDYLIAHGLAPKEDKPSANHQETALRIYLQENCDELRHNLNYPAFEIDFILRRGNQVAVIEAKSTRTNARKGMDQLNTIAGREYLGTYTGKIWVIEKELVSQFSDLAKAYRIEVVVVRLVSHAGKWRLDAKSKQRLGAALDKIAGTR